jgi:hypothetical protein
MLGVARKTRPAIEPKNNLANTKWYETPKVLRALYLIKEYLRM